MKGVKHTRIDGLLQVLNRLLLTGEARALLMMQPAELLEDLCVIRIAIKHTSVCKLCVVDLLKC